MPGTGLPPLRITVGRIDYTYEAENITFSNTDPGGYEMASFDVQANKAARINPGDRVLIMDGLGIIWQGRVAEPAKTIKHGFHQSRKVGAASTRVSCEGAGACLKDNLYSMVYVDRDLSRWGAPSTREQLVMANASHQLGQSQVGGGPVDGLPALVQSFTDSWASPWFPATLALYDAGPSNLIAQIYYNAVASANAAALSGIFADVYLASDDIFGGQESVSFTPTVAAIAAYFAPVTANRYAMLDFGTGTTPAGVQGATYSLSWRNLAVYGNHGMTGRGSDPVGFYTSDIALHAAQQAMLASGQMKIGRVDTMSQYVVPHYVQHDPVPHDTVLMEMSQLAPAHYGVWESSSTFDETPEFVFAAYGTDATVFTTLADCNEADVSERLANMYTSATITFSDAAGTTGAVTVSLPNSVLSIVGIKRTTMISLGLSSPAAAAVFASFVLQCLFAQARTAGSIDLPKKIRNRNGAPVASYRLKSGLDRIRIADLPSRAGEFTSFDNDSFRISRTESNVDTGSGEITTRVEIDAGPNLIETLHARLDQQTLVAAGGGS